MHSNLLNRALFSACFFAFSGLSFGLDQSEGGNVPSNQSRHIGYQGRLMDNGVDADGTYNFRFSLWNAVTTGDFIADDFVTLPVTNGYFNAELEFAEHMTETDLWIEIETRPAGSGLEYETLTPRQPLNSTPRAAFAHRVPDSLRLGDYDETSGRLFIANQNAQGPVLTIDRSGRGALIEMTDDARNPSVLIEPDTLAPGHFMEFTGAGGGMFIYDANNADGGPAISLTGRGEIARFSPAAPETDDKAILPIGSVSSPEMLDEPGVAADTIQYFSTFLPTSYTPIATRTIDCPADGYLLAVGSVGIGHAGGLNNAGYLALSLDGSTPYNAIAAFSYHDGSLAPIASTQAAVQIIPVSEGMNTVYLIARSENPSNAYYTGATSLALAYFPTAYAMTERPGQLQSGLQSSGLNASPPEAGSAPVVPMTDTSFRRDPRMVERQKELEDKVDRLQAQLEEIRREQREARNR